MFDDLFEKLAWLPAAPAGFKERVRNLATADSPGREARALSLHALDAAGLGRLANAVGGLIASGRSLAPLAPFKLGVLGNGTLDMIVPALVASALRIASAT